MGSKTYRYTHTLGREEALKRALPMADNLARKYMMQRSNTPEGFYLKGKGAEATVVVTEDAIEVTMDLSFLIEKIAGAQIESELNYKVPKALA
jgi:putative polyhydroxyalkanoate system protein